MKPKICVFYHALMFIGDPPELSANALRIVCEQMELLHTSGLLMEADRFVVGMNGGVETRNIANLLIPAKAEVVYHGLQSKSENLTLVLIEQFVKHIPEGDEWFVLYFHAKGASRPDNDPMREPWRQCMDHHLVKNWRKCVKDLEAVESVGCHWATPPKTPPTQYIWAGNFWWCRSSFLKTLPSIYERARIKESGIDSLESRYEAEVLLGNGPRPPTVKDYCPGWWPGKPHGVLSQP